MRLGPGLGGHRGVLRAVEARLLLASIDDADRAGRRDRALLAVMVYSFARVSAVVRMDVADYYQQGKRWWLRLHEKGGKQPRCAGPSQGGGRARRLSGRGRDRRRDGRAALADAGAGALRPADEPG